MSRPLYDLEYVEACIARPAVGFGDRYYWILMVKGEERTFAVKADNGTSDKRTKHTKKALRWLAEYKAENPSADVCLAMGSFTWNERRAHQAHPLSN